MAGAQSQQWRDRYGPWAVVAGASEGLGAAFAAAIAARGVHLVLLARREDLLTKVADELRAAHGVEVRTVALDLAQDDLPTSIAAATDDLEIGLLVYNAALSAIGPFLATPLATHVTEIAVNVRAPLTLAYHFGQRMATRGRGGIILMSSLSATMGSALIANYAATKAYNMVLAEGLWEELRSRQVDVLACRAGVVRTPNYLISRQEDSSASGGRGGMTPAQVAEAALKGLGHGPGIIPGLGNRISAALLGRLFPRPGAVRLMGSVMRGMYGTTAAKRRNTVVKPPTLV